MPSITIFENATGDASSHPAGHRFFKSGDRGEMMYVVLEGSVEIWLRGVLLETVTAGGIFGEMALIDHRERSADATAKTDVIIHAVDTAEFMHLVHHHPVFAIEVMTIMANRVRVFDNTIKSPPSTLG